MPYRPVAMPPQEQQAWHECTVCGALVRDTDLHSTTHLPARATVQPREYDQPPTEREYGA